MQVKFLTPARADVREIVSYYNDQREGLGSEFTVELRQTLMRVKHYPRAWSWLSTRVRRCRVNRFPFSVIYEVREDAVIVAAIQHHREEPNSWRNRIH